MSVQAPKESQLLAFDLTDAEVAKMMRLPKEVRLTERECSLLDWIWRGRDTWASEPVTVRGIAGATYAMANKTSLAPALMFDAGVVRRVLTGLTLKGALVRVPIGPRRWAYRLPREKYGTAADHMDQQSIQGEGR